MGFVLAAVLIFLTDLMLKKYVEANFEENEEHHLFNGKISIRKVHNKGFMCGGMDDHPEVVRRVTLFMLIGLLIKLIRSLAGNADRRHKTAAAFLAGGALSNWFDRFHQGYVTDYIRIPSRKLKRLGKVYFNLADVFLILGGLMLLFGRSGKKSRG